MFGFGRKLVSGKVISKSAYGRAALAKPVPLTKQNAALYQGTAQVLIHGPEDDGEWILHVEGVDNKSKPLTKDVYVDEMTWNNTAVGDPWPSTS